ncbi:Putative transposase [Aromatoleum tolulyticum]|uniref:Putative transposase n=1 Tax=Aromatoleum tolulyticum TaxID=34027 RepID=A0A1N6YAB0_9RHOO|nr:Putative transposase [Aromatoleum tolulyticum]
MAPTEEGIPVSGARALARLPGQVRRRPDQLARSERWPGGADWTRLKPRLYDHDWVVYAKQPLGGPEAVLEYLGRYTHRVAISNERIVGIDGDQIAFRVRADAGSGRKRTLRLPGVEFIGRFLLHVLPAGFKRIRHYGLLSPARKRSGLAAARAALDMAAPSEATLESVADFLHRVARIEHLRCPCYGSGQMRVVAVIAPEPRALHPRGPP